MTGPAESEEVDGLMTRISPTARWDDLAIAGWPTEQLKSIARRLRNPAPFEEWGFSKSASMAVTALFTGASGTGKTLAAEVIASDLSRDLLVVDLSSLVSKFIGETEKNLGRVFDLAQRSGAVLLFDEADTLFGKSSREQNTRDRQAKVDTSFLLQRIESYQGLVILTANTADAIDAPFIRRLRFVVEFSNPGAPTHQDLFDKAFAAAAPPDDIGRVELVDGAFVSSAADSNLPTVEFRYNPATLQRSLTPHMGTDPAQTEAQAIRFSGAPVETLTLDIEVDSRDKPQGSNNGPGVTPQLAALELFTYPSLRDVTKTQRDLEHGTLEVAAAAAPVLHFVQKPDRALPVHITSFQISEENFDEQLIPIRATVRLSMTVLAYED